MRLFVALDIDAEIRQRITDFRDELRSQFPAAKWVSPETFHVTLQFIGETEKNLAIQDALLTVISAPVQLSFRETGFFPNPQRARVFWVGIESDERLQQLADRIGAALAPLGFKRDAQEFHPHLTLAREGSGRPHTRRGDRPSRGLQPVWTKVEAMPQPDFGTMTAHEFYLYESKLSPSGAHYTKIAHFRLSESPADVRRS